MYVYMFDEDFVKSIVFAYFRQNKNDYFYNVMLSLMTHMPVVKVVIGLCIFSAIMFTSFI